MSELICPICKNVITPNPYSHDGIIHCVPCKHSFLSRIVYDMLFAKKCPYCNSSNLKHYEEEDIGWKYYCVECTCCGRKWSEPFMKAIEGEDDEWYK